MNRINAHRILVGKPVIKREGKLRIETSGGE
jgi:hypothetical protein